VSKLENWSSDSLYLNFVCGLFSVGAVQRMAYRHKILHPVDNLVHKLQCCDLSCFVFSLMKLFNEILEASHFVLFIYNFIM